MVPQQELQVSYSEDTSTPVDGGISHKFENHNKIPPAVDVDLAQNYKDKQNLPALRHGGTPELWAVKDPSSTEQGYIKIVLDEKPQMERQTTPRSAGRFTTETKTNAAPRDRVTGRFVSEDGRPCLRCIEKGLRCTLNYASGERDVQCAACRRSQTPYCVRLRNTATTGGDGAGGPAPLAFRGPPWKNPRFVAGTAAGGARPLPRAELEVVLRDFFFGESGYVLGNYVAEGDVEGYALPAFDRGGGWSADEGKGRVKAKAKAKKEEEEEEKREEKGERKNGGEDEDEDDAGAGEELMGWRRVLPIRQNRSLWSKRVWSEREAEMDGSGESTKMTATTTTTMTAAEEGGKKKEEGGDLDREARELEFVRLLRKYEPREQNLVDILGETW